MQRHLNPRRTLFPKKNDALLRSPYSNTSPEHIFMECCDVKFFVEEIKHIFQLVHLSASQVQCNTHQTISKLGLFQGSRIVAFLKILGITNLSFMQAHDDVLKQILFCQHWGRHCHKRGFFLKFIVNYPCLHQYSWSHKRLFK